MTRPEFLAIHDKEIRALALKLDVDMGVAGAIFGNACWWGHVPTGDEIAVQEALRECCGDDAYFKALQAEYKAVIAEMQ